MSRYTVSTNPEVVVGWDDPVGEFFGHVYDSDGEVVADTSAKDFDALALWLVVVPQVSVPADTLTALLADQRAHAGWSPGPLQRRLGYTGVFRCNPDESGGVA